MDNTYFKSSIVNSYPELAPSILRAPFDSKSLCVEITQQKCERGYDYLANRFGDFVLCEKGRLAIDLALSMIGLNEDDTVTILTTSGNYYVSSCVTKTVEKHCRWSRSFENNTKAIVVVHEFGYIYNDLDSLRKIGLPIIEDCASAFFSTKNNVGRNGDFAVYSFPKAMPMRMGGALVVNNHKYDSSVHVLGTVEEQYIMSCLGEQISSIPEIIEKRLANYHFFEKALSEIKITPFFPLFEGVVPEVFLFRWKDNIDYPRLKEFMQYNGVESSAFYGQPGFFIPVHHNLTLTEKKYIINLISFFCENNNL